MIKEGLFGGDGEVMRILRVEEGDSREAVLLEAVWDAKDNLLEGKRFCVLETWDSSGGRAFIWVHRVAFEKAEKWTPYTGLGNRPLFDVEGVCYGPYTGLVWRGVT